MLLSHRNIIANVSIADGIVQVMHQTVSEFFKAGGPTEGSRFRMAVAGAHVGISIACIRYLALCVTETGAFNFQAPSPLNEAIISGIRDRYTGNMHPPPLPGVGHNPTDLAGTGTGSWTSRDFEGYARCINDRPFLSYILSHLNDHLHRCHHAEGIPELLSKLCGQLINNPMSYLLWNLMATRSGKTQAAGEHQNPAKDFLNSLVWAATNIQCPRAVEASLAAGAIGGGTLDGKTLIMVCAENGDQATASVLLGSGVSIEATNGNRQTALHLAAANRHATMVQLLVDWGANKEAKDRFGQTALHVAAKNGFEIVVEMLVETLAVDREAKDMIGQTALHVASGRGHGSTARMLIEKFGVDRGSKDHSGRTALHFAAAFGIEKVVKILITTLQLDKECRDNSGKTALDLAREG
jgi:ankyrin repeat protein